jgi:hypothetical protein
MKTTRSILLLWIIISSWNISGIERVDAQTYGDAMPSRFYFRASAGYGIGINGHYAYNLDNTTTGITKTSTNTSKAGNGIYGLIAGGYSLNSNLGTELGLGYFSGFKNEVEYDKGQTNESKINLTGQMYQVIPALVYSVNISHVHPYLRAGLILGMPQYTIEFQNSFKNFNGGNSEYEQKNLYSGGLAIGVQGGLGCNFPITDQIGIFAEATFNNITYAPEKAVVEVETIDGADQLKNKTVSQKEYVFKSRIDPAANQSPDQPAANPLTSMPFGSFTLNFGIKINLGSAKTGTPAEGENQKFYARINSGFGWEMGGDSYQSYQDYSLVYFSQPPEYSGFYSYGTGINAGLGFGFMLTQNFGIDLGFNYAAGMQKFLETWPSNPTYLTTTIMHGNMFQVVPSVVFATRILQFQPYARMGLIAGMGTVYTVMDDHTPNGNPKFTNEHTAWKDGGGVSFGFNTTAGIAYPAGRNLDIFAEASVNAIYDIPEKATMTEFSWNGVDYLGTLTTQGKNKIYKSSWSSTDNNDKRKPMVASQVKYPFNSVVGTIGLRVRF